MNDGLVLTQRMKIDEPLDVVSKVHILSTESSEIAVVEVCLIAYVAVEEN